MDNHLYGKVSFNPAIVQIINPIPPGYELLSQDGVNFIVTEDGYYILVV